MDRRVAGIALLVAASACSKGHDPGSPGRAAVDDAAAPRPIVRDAGPVDAATTAPAEEVHPSDLVQGAEAELLIGQGRTKDLDPAARSEGKSALEGYAIDPDGVGPFRLGMAREVAARAFRWKSEWKTLPTQPGAPSLESATLPSEAGAPLVRLRVYAGRLTEIDVLAKDKRAATDRGIQVGSTFQAAIDAHGEARAVAARSGQPAGFVLADLPGVLLVPANPATLTRPAPAPSERIARIAVVGPEATAPDD